MDISIIVINYNTFELTCQCIRSIEKNLVKSSYEIILVDNGSTEITPSQFLLLFPHIVLIENKKNEGFARGNNIGIKRSSGDYVLLLNSDTEFMNDAATVCLEFLMNHPKVAVAGAALYYPNGLVQHSCQRFPSVSVKLFEFLRLQKLFTRKISSRILLGYFFDHSDMIYSDWIWGTFFMFKKSILNKLKEKKLADDFFMYLEDMQWCMEFNKLGYKIAYIPQAKVTHHMGMSKASKSDLIEANTKTFMNLYYSKFQQIGIQILDQLLAPRI